MRGSLAKAVLDYMLQENMLQYSIQIPRALILTGKGKKWLEG